MFSLYKKNPATITLTEMRKHGLIKKSQNYIKAEELKYYQWRICSVHLIQNNMLCELL